MTLSCATGFPDKTRKPPKKYKKQNKKNKELSNRGRNSGRRWRRGVRLLVSQETVEQTRATRVLAKHCSAN